MSKPEYIQLAHDVNTLSPVRGRLISLARNEHGQDKMNGCMTWPVRLHTQLMREWLHWGDAMRAHGFMGRLEIVDIEPDGKSATIRYWFAPSETAEVIRAALPQLNEGKPQI